MVNQLTNQDQFKTSLICLPISKTCYYFQISTSKAVNVKSETWKRNYQTRLLGAVSMNKTHHVFFQDESDRDENTKTNTFTIYGSKKRMKTS